MTQNSLKRRLGFDRKVDGWHDMEVFERSDNQKAESMWLPWSSRFFPALYRLLAVHDSKIEDQLNDVILTSEDRIQDDYI